ncbi:MAG: hypothetical protein VX519_12110 [Myxococcota bacterium]|nr:hypothetical protein [Myxococcota bacterium]
MFQGLIGLVALGTSAVASPVLKPTPIGDESYAETYTAVASLKDGSFVLMQLLFTNAGFGDRKAACRALWVPPGGTGINANANVDRNEWSYDTNKNALNVGPCDLASSSGGTRFSANLSDLSVTLQMQSKAHSVKPPGHRIAVGSDFHESDIVVARADATVTLRAGGKTLKQSGAAHLDHSRSNTLLPKAASCWMRFRGFWGAEPALVQVRMPPQNRPPKAWTWPMANAAPSAASAATVQVGKTAKGLPSLTVGDYALEATAKVYRYRPTEAYGALGRLAAPLIGDPTTTTYQAQGTSPGGAEISGILETLEVVEGGCRVQ